MCDRFEKKLYDLELTRNVSIQMGPQIRLIQSNDTMMAEKIQTTIVNTIPLWKNQMVLALGIAHSQQAMAAERAVTDADERAAEEERRHAANRAPSISPRSPSAASWISRPCSRRTSS